MAVVKGVFHDTSVLIAGYIDFGPESRPAHRVLDAVAAGASRGALTAWHCCLEFYAVTTRLPPAFRLAPADAVQLIEREILVRFGVLQLPDSAQKDFLALARRDAVVGGRIYDAHIAEIARRSGALMVVTDNRRHFTSLLGHGIRVLTTEELAAELEGRAR